MYPVQSIAHFVIDYCSRLGKPISNLKLQKILYFLWIDYFNHSKEHLFNTEMYAWQFGPVVPDVYNEYCVYGGNDIYHCYKEDILSDADRRLLSKFLDNYIDQPVSTLVTRSHQKGKPWDHIYNMLGQKRGKIPYKLIIERECD